MLISVVTKQSIGNSMINLSSFSLHGRNFEFALLELSDKNILLEGFKKLSSQSIYNRFHAAKLELSREELDYFLNIDNYHHLAIGVVEKIQNKKYGVGLIRYIRNLDKPAEAEVAITVVDAYQNLGLGTKLYKKISLSAKENGITTFTHDVLAQNRHMLQLLKKFNAQTVKRFYGTSKLIVNI